MSSKRQFVSRALAPRNNTTDTKMSYEDDEWSEDEWSDGDYYDDDDSSDVVECPECGADVYEDAEQCPSCGQYIIHSSGSSYLWKDRPAWWIILGILGILAVIIGLAGIPI